VDRITRKELKGDKFAREVGHTVEYVSEHRKQAIRYGIVGAAVLVAVLVVTGYRRQQHNARQAALTAAIEIQQAPVGPPTSEFVKSFPTEQERNSAAAKAFSDLVAKYSGSDEAIIAEYYLGAMAAEQDQTQEAEKWLKAAAESSNANYASLAKLTLADLYRWQGKAPQAEKLLRSLIAKPSEFVSKEQATIALAELLAPANPAEARKLLDPLSTTGRAAVGRAAMAVLSQLPRDR
jgi:predicted negative regulator of RcsB-dependent stress response